MHLYNKIKYGVPSIVGRTYYNWCVKDVVKTPPIKGAEDGLVVLTMLSHKYVPMYLVAVKSLYQFYPHGRYEVLDDGTLTPEDKEVLRYHVGGIQFSDFPQVKNDHCPKNGCWERLLRVGELAQQEKVLVMDSDILTQGPVQEMDQYLQANQSFILGTNLGRTIETMQEVHADEVKRHQGKVPEKMNLQNFFDTHMHLIPGFEQIRYVKGSAGFNGFGQQKITRDKVEELNAKMKSIFKARWEEWGTEQIAACILTVDDPEAKILNAPAYILHYALNDVDYNQSSVIHFIGKARYKKGYYGKRSKQFIRTLG